MPKQQTTDYTQHPVQKQKNQYFRLLLDRFWIPFYSYIEVVSELILELLGVVWGSLGGPGALGRLLGGMWGVTWLQDRVSEIFGTRRGGQGDPCWAQVGGMLRPSWDILGSKWAS